MYRLPLALIALVACSSGAPRSATPSDPTTTETVVGSNAQPAVGCPNIQIKAPDSVSAGQQASITTIAVDGPAPTYNWTVSSGKIASGQGTSAITIDTTGLSGTSVTATVEIGGLATECETRSASTTLLVGP